MPKKTFVLDSKNAEKLIIQWKGGIFLVEKDIEILLDEKIIKTFPNKDDVLKPKKIKLKDGSKITVQLVGKYEFNVLQNGKPLKTQSSSTDRVNLFANIFIVLGLFIVVFRWILLRQQSSVLDDWILWAGLLGGAALFVSGIEVKGKRYGFFVLGMLAFLVELAILIYERYLQNQDFGVSLILGAVVAYLLFSAAAKIPQLRSRSK